MRSIEMHLIGAVIALVCVASDTHASFCFAPLARDDAAVVHASRGGQNFIDLMKEYSVLNFEHIARFYRETGEANVYLIAVPATQCP